MWWQSILINVIIGIVVVLLIERLGRKEPKQLDSNEWSINVAAWLMPTCAIFFWILAGSGLLGLMVWSEGNWFWVAFSMLFIAFAVPSTISCFSNSEVVWNDTEIAGGGKLLLWCYYVERNTIRWEDIVKRGVRNSGYFFVEDEQGRRVYWTMYHSGHAKLDEFILQKRADLFD